MHEQNNKFIITLTLNSKFSQLHPNPTNPFRKVDLKMQERQIPMCDDIL